MSEFEKSRFDEGYESGFEAGKSERSIPNDLKARYAYLKHGGSWDLQTNIEENKYLAGFLDAMKTLGCQP